MYYSQNVAAECNNILDFLSYFIKKFIVAWKVTDTNRFRLNYPYGIMSASNSWALSDLASYPHGFINIIDK